MKASETVVTPISDKAEGKFEIAETKKDGNSSSNWICIQLDVQKMSVASGWDLFLIPRPTGYLIN